MPNMDIISRHDEPLPREYDEEEDEEDSNEEEQ